MTLVSACGGGDQAAGSLPSNSANASQANAAPSGSSANTASSLGVVSSHGGSQGSPSPAAATTTGTDSDRALLKTTELDQRIKETAGKAKAPNASAADKRAAAEAYLARGNAYFNAGQPRLYKYALADLKQVIRYDPGNAEAQEKIRTIEDIYRSLGRPVPEVPAEQ
jgi:hypothetical protein